MPYVNQETRDELDPFLDELKVRVLDPGDLNYIISRILARVVEIKRDYHTMSRFRAAVNDASDEFYRRVMIPYEDEKILENGDVYDQGS